MLGASSTSYRRSMMFANDPGAVVVQLAMSAVDASALTILVFFRKGFGERFFTVFKFGMGVAILSFLMGLRTIGQSLAGILPLVMGMFGVPPMLGMLAGPMLMRPHPQPVALFDAASLLYHAFIWVGFGHLVAVWLRSWRIGNAKPVHSRSTGEPLLSFGGRINHWLTLIVLEPLAVILLGRILHACDPRMPFAYFVILALFIQASALHQWRLYRDDLLDEQDARLLAGFAVQAKQSPVGARPAWNLGNFFKPLSLPGKAGLQVDLLRRWSKQHQELPPANDTSAPPPQPPAP